MLPGALSAKHVKRAIIYSTKQVQRPIRRSPHPFEDWQPSIHVQSRNAFGGQSMFSCLQLSYIETLFAISALRHAAL
jgi:hypothetical protein